MALLLNRLPQLRRFSLASQPSGNVASPVAKTVKSTSKARSFRSASRTMLSSSIHARYYAQESKGNNESTAAAEDSTSDRIPPPNMTTYPKAMQGVQTPVSPSEALGEIQIGPDGVVVPPKRPGAVASAEFVARKAPSSQQELLKRMYEIDKKLQSGKKDKTNVPETSTTKKRSSVYKAPEMVVFDYHPRRWVSTLNGVTCLASFPLHVWGFITLPPHLVAPLFAGSLVWLWWHRRVMNTTLTKLVLNSGHATADLTILNFFGMTWNRTVSIHSLTSVLGRRDSPVELTPDQAKSPIANSLATTEVLYLDVDELLVNAQTAEQAFSLKSANDTPFRTRYVVQQPLAKTFRHEQFLKFTGSPDQDPTTQAKNNLFN